jgi:hypothetical protein
MQGHAPSLTCFANSRTEPEAFRLRFAPARRAEGITKTRAEKPKIISNQ